MASQSFAYQSQSAELEAILAGWESRYQRRELSKTWPRTMIGALFISLTAGIIAYARFRWPAGDLALMTVAICGIGGFASLLHAVLFSRSRLTRARYFDLEFGLKERVSTALELLEGRIQTPPEIESAQIADALAQARQVDAGGKIGLDFRRREWMALLVLLVAVLLMILVPLLVGQELIPAGPSPAVQAAREDVREIIETAATDTSLEDIDRKTLLNALEMTLERLQAEDISAEEAFAAMSQLESRIEDIANALQDGIDLDQSSLEAAAQAIEAFMPLADRQENASGAESEQAARMSLEAARELAQTNPELSERLQNMAAALQSGDRQSLQEQLDQAQEQLRQARQAVQEAQSGQQMLQDQAERAEQAASEIAQQQAASQQGEAETSDAGRPRGAQPGGEQADAARAGASQGDQPALQNMPGGGENPASQQDSDSAGQGAGEGRPSNTSLPGSGGEDQGAETDNRSTGAGEIDYAAIYNPTGIDGGGADEIRLATGASDQTFAEGNFDDNPLGESRVSYDTVFSDYQHAANRALESDYVPLGLRDVVRDYFTSLEP